MTEQDLLELKQLSELGLKVNINELSPLIIGTYISNIVAGIILLIIGIILLIKSKHETKKTKKRWGLGCLLLGVLMILAHIIQLVIFL